MAEHVLRGQLNIADDNDINARNVVVIEPSGEIYRIPMSLEGAAEFGAALQKSPEQLVTEAAEAAAAARAEAAKPRVVVPGMGAPLPDLGRNGNGSQRSG